MQFIRILPVYVGIHGTIAVCVSPLTSPDQLFLSTEFKDEGQSDIRVKEKVLNSGVQLMYITPESVIETSQYRDMLLTLLTKKSL